MIKITINRKDLIVNAATKSFSMFGYKATTMDQVAKLANVGKGTIYTFFDTKEDLFYEIVTDLIQQMKQVAINAIDPDLSFKDNVHQALYQMLEFRLTHQLTIKLFQEGRDIGTSIVQEAMDKVENEIISFIKEKVIKAIDEKEIKACDPELTAYIILKLYIALIFDWEKRREPLHKRDIATIFDRYLFQGLSAN